MHEELRLDKQICFRLYTATRLITQAYAIIPAGMGKELRACPFQLDDYAKFASELDTIIETLKNKEK